MRACNPQRFFKSAPAASRFMIQGRAFASVPEKDKATTAKEPKTDSKDKATTAKEPKTDRATTTKEQPKTKDQSSNSKSNTKDKKQ